MKMSWLRSRRVWLLLIGGIVLAVVGSMVPLKDWFEDIRGWLTSLGAWATPAFILLYLLATILGLPNILLILVAGTLFGLINGVISVSIADTLGAMACFIIGRTIARKRIKRLMSKYPSLAQLDHAVGRKGWKVLLLTRLSPLVPSNILNYGFSCTKVNFWQYCFFSWLGMLPVIILYVYLGSFGTFLLNGELTSEKLALQAGGLLITIVAAFYTARFAKKYITPSCSDESNQ
jgi:uncharacterized membrane protein YdjX (TVP38/TMEM64 family)